MCSPPRNPVEQTMLSAFSQWGHGSSQWFYSKQKSDVGIWAPARGWVINFHKWQRGHRYVDVFINEGGQTEILSVDPAFILGVMDREMDGWMDGWTDRRTDGQTNQSPRVSEASSISLPGTASPSCWRTKTDALVDMYIWASDQGRFVLPVNLVAVATHLLSYKMTEDKYKFFEDTSPYLNQRMSHCAYCFTGAH